MLGSKISVKAEELAKGIDEDDTEFVVLTEQIKGKLWTGDLRLSKGLARKSWNRWIYTSELYSHVFNKRRREQ